MTTGDDETALKRGDAVVKINGYAFPGVVVSSFLTLRGLTRVVVEATGADYRGMLHIFNPDQLRKVNP